MCKYLLLLLFSASFFCSQAGVLFKDTLSVSRKQHKEIKRAGNRIQAFYNWYINFKLQNASVPSTHLVIDQYCTAHMRSMSTKNSDSYDVFFAGNNFDTGYQLEITTIRLQAGRLSLKAHVNGKVSYNFFVDMIIQQGMWRVDLVVPDETPDMPLED